MSKYHNLEPFVDRGRTRKLRQWLNLLFIIGGIVGMAWFTWGDHDTALYIMIAAGVLKFVDLSLRIAKL